MTSPEQTDYYPRNDQAPFVGALSLLPTVSIVEQVRLRWQRQPYPAPLVTKRSLRRYQQTSDYAPSPHLIGHAWSALSACVPGTIQATRYQELIQSHTPDFTSHSVVDTHWPVVVAGFHPETFPAVIDEAVAKQKYVPQLGETAVRFLEEVATVMRLNTLAEQFPQQPVSTQGEVSQ